MGFSPNSKSTTDPSTTTTGIQQENSDINKENDRKTNKDIPEENDQMTDKTTWLFVGIFVGAIVVILIVVIILMFIRKGMTVYML